MKIICECAVCGETETLTLRLPRFGPVPQPAGGKHPERVRFLHAHLHPDQPPPAAWAKPLLNPEAHVGGIDLQALGMRLEADLLAAENDQ